jgi:hypothetical protein
MTLRSRPCGEPEIDLIPCIDLLLAIFPRLSTASAGVR